MIYTKSYYSNGVCDAEGLIIDNLQFGWWTFYFEDGNLFSEGEFDNKGNPIGVWKEYYRNGQKKYEAISKTGNTFSLSDDNLEIINYWTEDGNLMIDNGNGQLILKSESQYPLHISNWVDRRKEGILREFYSDGNIWIEKCFSNGRKDGETKIFHKNGNLHVHRFYGNGKCVGNLLTYYEDGQLCEEGFFRASEFSYHENDYFIKNFWDENGQQTLKDGFGYVIEDNMLNGSDGYISYYENYKNIKRVR